MSTSSAKYILKIKFLNPDNLEEFQRFEQFYPGDAGFDIFILEDMTVPAKKLGFEIPLGIAVEMLRDIKVGFQNVSFILHPRSSMGAKTPLRMSNSIGIIDSGYRGQLTGLVDNLSESDFEIKKGERYFQICAPSLKNFAVEYVSELSETTRGTRGLGSTGK